jgi:hypothetical protein
MDDLEIPDIGVTRGTELSAVTAVEPHIVGEVVIQTEIKLIHIGRG